MKKITFALFTLLMSCFLTLGQQLGLTFSEAQEQGIRISQLDSIYKNALHSDTSLAVFKTDEKQKLMREAYIKLLQDFGIFLNENNFRWEKPTRCFNRIYFNSDGTIDYFLFNFLSKTAEEKLSEEKQNEFKHLLNRFIQDYTFSLTAETKFAQCSPTTYMP